VEGLEKEPDPKGKVNKRSMPERLQAKISQTNPPAFHILVKPTGAVCNLHCDYCFYLDKKRLYPEGRFRMSEALLETYVRALVEAQGVPPITMAWQGGEPLLMGLDFFRRSLEIQKKYQRPGVYFNQTIQTNGTLIDEKWAQFFKEHHFLVGISIDGPKDMHDAYRRDPSGRPTFDRVIRGLEWLQMKGVEFNALVTVHQANADHPLEVYRFLRDGLGIRFIQLIPIVERLKGDERGTDQDSDRPKNDAQVFSMKRLLAPYAVTPDQWGDFLITVFEEWVHHDVGEVFVNIFDTALAKWAGEPSGLCVFEPVCGTALVLEHNGDLYACDHFVDPEHFLGNITERPLIELWGSPKQQAFGQRKTASLPKQCFRCPFLFACHGGCPKDRWNISLNGEAGLNVLCSGYQAFFRHIEPAMQIMTELLRLNRAPAEIRNLYSGGKAFPKAALHHIGRNEPCPCGSKKKFKHCHGR